ncbi:MAG: EthD family reductase [Sulfobacillus sp.]|nr:EthD family reductase [Sulfobacillus sp.]
MVKLIALYRRPDDPAAFDRHYAEVHTPLVRKMPGLQALTVVKLNDLPGMSTPYYLLAEMTFADQEALKQAMRSDAGRAAAKDLQQFAGGLVDMMVGEEFTAAR